MLHIYYGEYQGKNYIFDPDTYFNNQADRKWLLEDLPRQMIHDVDKSEVISENLIQSSRLGPIPPQWLSGSVKTLILIENDSGHVFNTSACGQNCAKWLLQIGNRKDVLIRLGYPMDFGKEEFNITIENNGHLVHTMKDLMNEIVDYNLL
ncbi:DUF4869 domain-containing protein [Bilifractor porci]|uniref:DUF4869 domain-containing protein n=1 Tax=Bilifractor porci TaxID=2606636 RepID=A0A7X2PA34_9FIRM|nr:DUF4869 domain-containing protein [Bilifractor porci]MST82513.1 DUF4869 domain-containing protein [Bilifractor porci]